MKIHKYSLFIPIMIANFADDYGKGRTYKTKDERLAGAESAGGVVGDLAGVITGGA